MVGADGQGPTYLASHSADVILSDIRPIKLKPEPLRAINVFLDELLYTILNTSRSLTTEKIKGALLQILPTNLGKDALLEAEVELRAYWDRTGKSAPNDIEAADNFNLQWTFELLRLKCEGFSTLNDSDEDANAETRLNDRFSKVGGNPPNSALLAPAALYLTAILESMCEHILTNVGRVAARDSSRTSATIQDLFTALCEDDSIYGLFKTMKVHEQIATLSKLPRPHRTRSISRGMDRGPPPSAHVPVSASRNRVSADTPSSTVVPSRGGGTPTPRSSFDKARMKMFNNPTRPSNERDRAIGPGPGQEPNHKRSESTMSEETRKTLVAYGEYEKSEPEDATLLQDFDKLMRSDATVKVSLTPDRLKTMEVYNKEKAQAAQRTTRKAASASEIVPSKPRPLSNKPSLERTNGNSSLRHVESVIEEEDEGAKPDFKQGGIQGGMPTASSHPVATRVPSGTNTVSLTRRTSRKDIPSLSAPASPVQPVSARPHGAALRDSTDVDSEHDIPPADSGDDSDHVPAGGENTRHIRRKPSGGVSAATRDLMDFLEDGPPAPPSSFNAHASSFGGGVGSGESLKSAKGGSGSGRLQKMISRFAGGDRERDRQRSFSGVESQTYHITSPTSSLYTSPVSASLPSKRSFTKLGTPQTPMPRSPVLPLSPPSSPPQSSAEAQTQVPTPTGTVRKPSVTRKALPAWEEKEAAPDPPGLASSPQPNGQGYVHPDSSSVKGPEVPRARGHAFPAVTVATPPVKVATPTRTVFLPDNRLIKFGEEARTARQLMARATTAEECRLLFEVFLAKAGVSVSSSSSSLAANDAPYPSPATSDGEQEADAGGILEQSILELFLSSEGDAAGDEAESAFVTPTEEVPVSGNV